MFSWATFFIFHALTLNKAFGQCGFNVSLQPGQIVTFSSPYFPDPYPIGTQCFWTATSQIGTKIGLRCDYFNVRNSFGCQDDAFWFSPSGNKFLKDAVPYCGTGVIDLSTTSTTFSAAFYTKYWFYQPFQGFQCSLRSIPNCDCGVKGVTRIVGGQLASVGQWPWQALIRRRSTRESLCGGVLIDKYWVLTASHCAIQFPEIDLLVSLGVFDRNANVTSNTVQEFLVAFVISHPRYNGQTEDNDIALIRLASAVVYTQTVRPVCLPLKYTAFTFVGLNATATGWGFTNSLGNPSNFLREVKLPIINQTLCRKFMGQTTITENMLCTYAPGRDACKGDSGGPLVWQDTISGRNYLIGIISFGYQCALPNYAGVYTKVGNYVNWIQEQIQTNLCYR